tara:strand:+ start:1511 stop:2509 length:999 start_codon:yes stop_codon:yes gene_type:complete
MSSLKEKPLKKCHTDKRKMIDDIHSDIVNKKDNLIDYYLDNGVILDKYYSENTGNKKEKIDDNKVGILSYFKTKNDSNENDTNDTNGNICDKKKIINEYMCNIYDSVENNKYEDYKLSKCELCEFNLCINNITGELICTNCGYTNKILIVSEKNSYNDPPKEANYFSYKRINHFNEWLAQFQAKENTEIPDNIYKDIYNEIKKNINLDIHTLNYKQIREILKKLKHNKYYEHIPHLLNVLSGEKAPIISRKSEEILRSLFKEIQIPFMKHCPPSRKNFLSYSYVLHKFCELLEYDHLLSFFPLLKSREKLQQQDKIWRKICEEVQWEYIPST